MSNGYPMSSAVRRSSEPRLSTGRNPMEGRFTQFADPTKHRRERVGTTRASNQNLRKAERGKARPSKRYQHKQKQRQTARKKARARRSNPVSQSARIQRAAPKLGQPWLRKFAQWSLRIGKLHPAIRAMANLYDLYELTRALLEHARQSGTEEGTSRTIGKGWYHYATNPNPYVTSGPQGVEYAGYSTNLAWPSTDPSFSPIGTAPQYSWQRRMNIGTQWSNGQYMAHTDVYLRDTPATPGRSPYVYPRRPDPWIPQFWSLDPNKLTRPLQPKPNVRPLDWKDIPKRDKLQAKEFARGEGKTERGYTIELGGTWRNLPWEQVSPFNDDMNPYERPALQIQFDSKTGRTLRRRVKHKLSRSKRRTKERKVRSAHYGPKTGMLRAAEEVGEAVDIVWEVWKALPREIRDGHYNDPPHEKAYQIYKWFHLLDVEQAAENVLMNELEDRLYAERGKLSKKIATDLELPYGLDFRGLKPKSPLGG